MYVVFIGMILVHHSNAVEYVGESARHNTRLYTCDKTLITIKQTMTLMMTITTPYVCFRSADGVCFAGVGATVRKQQLQHNTHTLDERRQQWWLTQFVSLTAVCPARKALTSGCAAPLYTSSCFEFYTQVCLVKFTKH